MNQWYTFTWIEGIIYGDIIWVSVVFYYFVSDGVRLENSEGVPAGIYDCDTLGFSDSKFFGVYDYSRLGK